MPELPEVETVRRQLSDYLPLTIMSVKLGIHGDSLVEKKEFQPKGKTITAFHRHGKMLQFIFDDFMILSHFGMTGGWRIAKEPSKEKHLHVEFKVTNPNQETLYLGYVDYRRFGVMYWIKKENLHLHMKNLGVDIASSEFTLEYLTKAIKKYPERALKVTLLDQKLFAGCGNYIACEICARAFMRPTRKCKKIKKDEFKKIHEAVKVVLDGSINTQGNTFSGGYVDANGEEGAGVQNLVVFWQKVCRMCNKTEVKKIFLAARGTYYCPKCQK
ncbi:MAG: Fpg/Nei family DNA glycosylase [Bacteriovoracaceae bacterium]